MRKQKKIVIPLILSILVTPVFLRSQYSSYSLYIKSTLFEGTLSEKSSIQEPQKFIFLSEIIKTGDNQNISKLESSLKKIFSLQKLINWGEAEVKLEWSKKRPIDSKVSQALLFAGKNIIVDLTPLDIDFKNSVFKIKMEIYEETLPSFPLSLRTRSLLSVKELDFGTGEYILGFFNSHKTYLISLEFSTAFGVGISRPPIILPSFLKKSQ